MVQKKENIVTLKIRKDATPYTNYAVVSKHTLKDAVGNIFALPYYQQTTLIQFLWMTIWQYLLKLQMEVAFDPPFLFREMYPSNILAHLRNICTSILIGKLQEQKKS